MSSHEVAYPEEETMGLKLTPLEEDKKQTRPKLYPTRIAGCPKRCKETHCCATCANYDGGIEIIPMTLWVTCKAIKGKSIAFRWGPKPYIDGVCVEKCKHWKPYKLRKRK